MNRHFCQQSKSRPLPSSFHTALGHINRGPDNKNRQQTLSGAATTSTKEQQHREHKTLAKRARVVMTAGPSWVSDKTNLLIFTWKQKLVFKRLKIDACRILTKKAPGCKGFRPERGLSLQLLTAAYSYFTGQCEGWPWSQDIIDNYCHSWQVRLHLPHKARFDNHNSDLMGEDIQHQHIHKWKQSIEMHCNKQQHITSYKA